MAVLVVVAAAGAWTSPSIIRIAGALGVLAMAAAVAVDRDPDVARSRVLAAVGMTALNLADAGLDDLTALDLAAVGGLWRPLAAVVAYPVLGRALLLMVGRFRQVRPTDVIVEAALIGSAAAIAVQVTVTRLWVEGGTASAGVALGSLLVGLDVALVVVVARSLTTEAARLASVAVVTGSVGALLVGHVAAALDVAKGGAPSAAAAVAVAGAIVALGAGSLHDALVARPAQIPAEAPLFSRSHAAIVVVAVLAPPAVLAAQVVWGVSVSGAVAVGAGLIGTVLAGHVISLLQERAGSEHQATHDALTDLPNRVLFMDRLERALAHAIRNDVPVGVLYIDLDRFKDVNDTFGHDAGDHLLRETARRLADCARHEDTVARLAGDEFAVLLPHLRAADDIVLVADRMLAALREPITVAEHAVHGGGSVGVAVFPHDGSTPADLLNAADAAMYRAKEHGGCRIEMYSAELHEAAVTRLELETALHHAIEDDQLLLLYQPILDAETGRTLGAEALVRWMHPERGMVPPGEFIPVAEQSDLIVDLGNWVIREACRQLAEWARAGLGDRFIAINVSPRHFREDLARSVASALRDTGADPSNLVVELTENAAVDDVGMVASRLRELRDLGVEAAIDDFGTGYSGLQYLGDLPVSTLKIDRSFVQAMTPTSAAIVAGTIAMARTLGLTIVAEGVETEEQRRFLRTQGCDRLQGYHLGRPMPAQDFADRLREEDRVFAEAHTHGRLTSLMALPPTAAGEGGPRRDGPVEDLDARRTDGASTSPQR
ncbi:MAG TPA: EAL domain-containing protein [Acidimicrobiales bacterium]|nr:EAL domain-containing protein [Acidimicrobiales bacterium]